MTNKKLTTAKAKKKAWTVFSIWVRQTEADENGMVTCYTCYKKAHWKYQR